MKNCLCFLVLLLAFGACKEKDLTPRLVGVWEAMPTNTRMYKDQIEFTKDGIINLGFMDCYCADGNTYKVSSNKIKINLVGRAKCYPIVDCPRPSNAVVVELTGDFLTIDWIYNTPYPSNLNYQQKYRRL